MRNVAKFEKVPFEEFLESYNRDLKFNLDEDAVRTIYDNIKLPVRSSKHSAGYDFRSTAEIVIKPGQTVNIPSGIRCRMNEDFVLLILPRSSMGFKYNMILTNTVGVIDSDYYGADNYGHIKIEIKNTGNKDHHIELGERFAQGIFLEFGITDDDAATDVRTGGIGSTGKH